MENTLRIRKQLIDKSKIAVLNTQSSVFSKLNGKRFEVLYMLGISGVTLNINGVHTDFCLSDVIAG